MSSLRRLLRPRRPSPAFVVAVFALLVAAGVPAQAGLLISGKQIRNHSVRGVDIAHSTITGINVKNHSLTAHDFRGSVQGPAGSAVAYAHVSAAGVLDPLRTKGVLKVTRPATGLYCFFGTPALHNVIATLDRNNQGTGVSVRGSLGPGPAVGNVCGGVESASIRVYDKNGTGANDSFWVSFN